MNNWSKYNESAKKYMKQVDDYEDLKKYFKEGDWMIHEHVDKSVNILYSEEMYFRFNRNLDLLKKEINHHKKEDEEAMNWFEARR